MTTASVATAFKPARGFFEFAFQRFSDLEDPRQAVNDDWDPQVARPDELLASNGLYDVLELIDARSLLDLFSLRFVWSGGPAGPGPQPYTLYDANCLPIASGLTTLAPTAPILASLALGLLPLAVRRLLAGMRGSGRSNAAGGTS